MNCGRYKRFGIKSCSSHFIKVKELNDAILKDIQSKAKFVLENETKARKEFLSNKSMHTNSITAKHERRLPEITNRLTELDNLIKSTYEDKVLNKIPENICIDLLMNYQNEKDVDEYIKRIKHYATAPILTREMCLELIEFVTIDEYNPDNKTRDIHIYYKLIDNIKGQDFSLSKRESNQLVPMFQI